MHDRSFAFYFSSCFGFLEALLSVVNRERTDQQEVRYKREIYKISVVVFFFFAGELMSAYGERSEVRD